MAGDRAYYGVLVERARTIVDVALADLQKADTSDGHCAPHVSVAKLRKLRRVAAKLEALANLAHVEAQP